MIVVVEQIKDESTEEKYDDAGEDPHWHAPESYHGRVEDEVAQRTHAHPGEVQTYHETHCPDPIVVPEGFLVGILVARGTLAMQLQVVVRALFSEVSSLRQFNEEPKHGIVLEIVFIFLTERLVSLNNFLSFLVVQRVDLILVTIARQVVFLSEDNDTGHKVD